MPHHRAINIGQMPHHFAINCNKYYINKSHSFQIAPTRGQNADQNPQGGDAIDDQIPHICPPPPLGVNIDRCIKRMFNIKDKLVSNLSYDHGNIYTKS